MVRGFRKGGFNARNDYLRRRKTSDFKSTRRLASKASYSNTTKSIALMAIKSGVKVKDCAQAIGCTRRSIQNWRSRGIDNKRRGPSRKVGYCSSFVLLNSKISTDASSYL